jgi:hypothetical protein
MCHELPKIRNRNCEVPLLLSGVTKHVLKTTRSTTLQNPALDPHLILGGTRVKRLATGAESSRGRVGTRAIVKCCGWSRLIRRLPVARIRLVD